jgi:hypothetical protein
MGLSLYSAFNGILGLCPWATAFSHIRTLLRDTCIAACTRKSFLFITQSTSFDDYIRIYLFIYLLIDILVILG